MRGMRGYLPVCLTALCPLACIGGSGADEARPEEAAPEQVLLKGHAVFGHEVRSIRPCDAEEAVWAIDSTGLLWQVHQELAPHLEPYEEIFVVVLGHGGDAPTEGFGADYPGSFVVDKVVYAAGEGFGCNLELDSIRYRASGNEPFWTLLVTGSAIELMRLGEASQSWNQIRSVATESAVTYIGEGSGSTSVEATISQGPCRDSMSGAFFWYRATVVLAGETLDGCALRGG